MAARTMNVSVKGLLVVIIMSVAPLAHAISLGDIVRKGDPGTEEYCIKSEYKEVCLMSQGEADSYCKSEAIKSRLPTVRELADYSQSLGAKGVGESACHEADDTNDRFRAERTQMYGNGYGSIYKRNTDGTNAVDFYFNKSGYKRPVGDLGNDYFWSSSFHPIFPDFPYVLSGVDGGLYGSYIGDGYNSAVRCVRDL